MKVNSGRGEPLMLKQISIDDEDGPIERTVAYPFILLTRGEKKYEKVKGKKICCAGQKRRAFPVRKT
jgi:hypothetical protein